MIASRGDRRAVIKSAATCKLPVVYFDAAETSHLRKIGPNGASTCCNANLGRDHNDYYIVYVGVSDRLPVSLGACRLLVAGPPTRLQSIRKRCSVLCSQLPTTVRRLMCVQYTVAAASWQHEMHTRSLHDVRRCLCTLSTSSSSSSSSSSGATQTGPIT